MRTYHFQPVSGIAIVLLSVFCVLLLPSLGKEPATRDCRILFLDRPADAPKTLYLFDGEQSREVELPKMNFSDVYELPGGPLRIHLLRNPVDSPENLPEGGPSGVIGETVTDVYLILTSDRDNPVVPVRMGLINAGSDRLRKGQTMWINTTDLTIGGILGDKKIKVGKHKRLISDAPMRERGTYDVRLAYQNGKDGLTYPICQTKWQHDPRCRNVAFIIAKTGVRTPRVLVVPDFRRTEKPKETTDP